MVSRTALRSALSSQMASRPGKGLKLHAVICMVGLLSSLSAWAGVFSVTPVRIYMAPRDRAVAVTVINEGDTEVVLQADLNSWTQKPDGTDEQVATDDLILSPPIIKLAPRARQVVRLALLKPADASRQLIYRMIMREVSEASPSREQVIQMPIALALSLPVFITPPPAKREIDCLLAKNDANTLNVSCANTGSAYAQVREVLITRGETLLGKFVGGLYILPGARKAIAVTSDLAVTSGLIQLKVSFDDGKSQIFEGEIP